MRRRWRGWFFGAVVGLALFAGWSVRVAGYLQWLNPAELAHLSELVFIGTIVSTEKGDINIPYQRFRHRLTIEEFLKGTLPVRELELITVLLMPGQGGEDPPLPLPGIGSRCLFFVAKDAHDRWRLVESRQGCWPLTDGELIMPGRPSLAEVKKMIESSREK